METQNPRRTTLREFAKFQEFSTDCTFIPLIPQIFLTKYCILFWHTIMRLKLQYLAKYVEKYKVCKIWWPPYLLLTEGGEHGEKALLLPLQPGAQRHHHLHLYAQLSEPPS
jgi:hypothetical protein